MRIELPRLSLQDQLLEFDDWVTPSLGEIKDTDKFETERKSICRALDALGSHTNDFVSLDEASPTTIAESVVAYVSDQHEALAEELLLGVFSLLFVVTGKSDNNCKCQFPVYLRDVLRWESFPRVEKKEGSVLLKEVSLPRVIGDSLVAKTVASLSGHKNERMALLSRYIEFLLNEEVYLKSFWALGHAYFKLKQENAHEEFLAPLVVFRIRGSVSASGGHDPENLLRARLEEWGLSSEYDFNANDVVVGGRKGDRKTKTRAYDFVLPYKTEGWEPRIFVQCQFYAGDSGSVSHKNVDQIRTSRVLTKKKFNKPLFVEYMDGAGYFASLNGDLKRILQMRDTHSFFQVRTSVLKLRAALQDIGFLTPLEVAHYWSVFEGSIPAIKEHLLGDGYLGCEIERALSEGVRRGIFEIRESKLEVGEAFKVTSRRYLLLDLIALAGKRLDVKDLRGAILVPGFGERFGVSLSEVVDNILPQAGVFGVDWSSDGLVLKDIEFIAKMGWIDQR